MEDETGGVLLALLFMTIAAIIAIAVIIATGMLHIRDDYDDVNTKVLGSIICEEQGLEYSEREFNPVEYKGTTYYNVPTIYCTNKSNEKIIDGIVVKR